jgi:hypothetical protein
MKRTGPVTLADVEEALAGLGAIIRAEGARGLEYLPIFERLERERENLATLDARIDLAISRMTPEWRKRHLSGS